VEHTAVSVPPPPCAQVCVDILQKAGVVVDCKSKVPPAELKKIIGEYDGLIVRSGTTVTAEIIESAHKMTAIGRAGTGVDNIDCVAATKKGIIVMNTPGGNTVSAAEHTRAPAPAKGLPSPRLFTPRLASASSRN